MTCADKEEVKGFVAQAIENGVPSNHTHSQVMDVVKEHMKDLDVFGRSEIVIDSVGVLDERVFTELESKEIHERREYAISNGVININKNNLPTTSGPTQFALEPDGTTTLYADNSDVPVKPKAKRIGDMMLINGKLIPIRQLQKIGIKL